MIDFTDPSAPQQLGFYIAKEPRSSTSWSSYWYNGHMYVNNFETSSQGPSRGFDVMTFTGDAVAGAIELPRLNPQTVEALPEPEPVAAPKPARVLGQRTSMPATGVAMQWGAGFVLLAAAALAVRLIRQ